MSATVLPMPARPPAARGAELEAMLLGAALHLKLAHGVFELVAITGEEFSVELHRKAWQIARRRAEKGLEVGAAEVYAAGFKAGWFTDARQLEQLERLEGTNTLSVEAFKRVAADFRTVVEGQRYIAALEQALQRVRARGFDASAESGWLSALDTGIRSFGARLEPLTAEQERYLATWQEREESGRPAYIPTGLLALDAEIGGLPESLTLIVADAGVGKTAFQDTLLHSVLLANPEAKAALISPEDGVRHVIQRWMARDLGWLMRDVGSKRRTAAEAERVQEIAGAQYSLLERVLGWKHRSLTIDKLISLCWSAADAGCRVISIDNFNKLNISGLGGDYHERVQRASDRLQEVGEKAGVAVILLAHSTDDSDGRKPLSSSSGVQGGRALGRDARLRLDLSEKGGALRVLIAKANTQGRRGTVIDFERLAEAGLIRADGGAKVDVNAEAAQERRRKLAEKMRESRDVRKQLAEAEPKAEPTAAPEPPPAAQPALFEGDTHDAE